MLRRYAALLVACVSLSVVSVRADDGMTSFHYMDLYNIQESVSDMQDLKGLRVDIYVTSVNPGVFPYDITLTMHRASGAQETIPHDPYDHVLLPVSDALKAENPLITTNQPKHSLNASVFIDLVAPTGTELRYDALMLGVMQLNQAIEQKRLSALNERYAHKAIGLLVFYGGGKHSLTLHGKAGDQILKSTSVDKQASHLKGFNTAVLASDTRVIYVPMDAATLEENPRVSLDAPAPQIFPAF